MGRLIAVCGKGGKSTISANLAYQIAKKNVTLIFDTNLSCGSLGYRLSTPIKNDHSLNKILMQTSLDIKDGIVQHERFSNLFILSVSDDTNWLDFSGRNLVTKAEFIKELIFEIKAAFDYIIVDCEQNPNNIISLYSMMYADKIVNVFNPDMFGLAELNSFRPFLSKLDKSKIINVANADRNFVGLTRFESCSQIKIDITLPYDFRVQKYNNQGQPFSDNQKSVYSVAFKELVNFVIGGDTFGG